MREKLLQKTLFSICLVLTFALHSFGQNQSVPFANLSENCNETSKSRERIVENEIFKILNQKRVEEGLELLRWSEELAQIARLHSENMVKLKFFSHTDPEKNTIVERAKSLGIKQWKTIGENIGYIKSSDNIVFLLCEMWMKSKPHRKNILNSRYKETGVGVAIAEDGTYYVTQVFIER